MLKLTKAPLFLICLVLCVLVLVSCQLPRGGDMDNRNGNVAGDVDTGAETKDKSPTVKKAESVSISYGAIGTGVGRLMILSGLVGLGLLLLATAAPSPQDPKLVGGLYLAALACGGVAIFLAYSWYGV